MAVIIVPGLSLSTKTPRIYLAVIFGGAGVSAGVAPSRTLLLENKIEADISRTIGATTYLTTAGVAPLTTVTQVFTESDARVKFGDGSGLQRQASAFLRQYPQGQLFAIPVALAGGGTVGSMTFTFVGAATAAGSVRVYLCGSVLDVAIASGDAVGTMAANVAHAINRDNLNPCYAEVAAGVVTIKSKAKAARANEIPVHATLISGQTEIRILTTGTTLLGTTVTASAYVLSGGAGADSLTAALAAVTNTRYHRYCVAQNDATNLALVKNQLNTMASATAMKWQQAIACSVASLATASALAFDFVAGTGINAERVQLAWHFNSPLISSEVAAYVTAARLNGEGAVGGSLPGEDQDPACNHDGVILPFVLPQYISDDQPEDTEIEAALNNGLTPLAPAGGGGTYLVRSVTTRCADPISKTPNYAVIDTQIVTVCDNTAEEIAIQGAPIIRGSKLAPDSTDGSGPKIRGVLTPSAWKGFVLGILDGQEKLARIVNVQERKDELQALINPQVRGRLDFDAPCEPIQITHVVGGNVRQRG